MQQLDIFHQGYSLDIHHFYGAHITDKGVCFCVYAPSAQSVQIIGSFNNWDGTYHVMEKIDSRGTWLLHIDGVKEWESYKYRLLTADNKWIDKADPVAFYSETRPETASKIVDLRNIEWTDEKWMRERTKNFNKPLSIYEVYAGAWKIHENGMRYTYQDLETQLIPYIKEKGFTHVELMPLSEHPFDGSWGYQSHGYFSCTSRYGNPKEFAQFVNACHLQGVGVIIDVVPVHFVKDAHGLVQFDGSAVYEYQKASDAESEWGTLNFDLWKEEVRSFLMSSLSFWCEKYHIDGIRMDAISNLIYWKGNKQLGINEGALNFIKRMNQSLIERYPQVILIAEDSSDFSKVTHATWAGGLGFDYKWDLGWMNDTLSYYKKDPIFRSSIHHCLTFSMAYFYSERFLLPLSHDEVVHGKKTIVDRMWGDYHQKFSQAKNLYTYMFTHPGKKLNFMGNEIGMIREFDEDKEMDWFLLKYPKHDAFARYFKDLNQLYCYHPSLSRYDYDYEGFKWIDADNAEQSIYSYYRECEEEVMVVLLNMTPQSHEVVKIGVPYEGDYVEILNSEKDIYDGCNMCNYEPIQTEKESMNQLPYTLCVRVAPFAAIILRHQKKED